MFVAFAAPAHAEKRVALVIGNNDYRNVPKLQKAVNDARTMGDTLKQLGFSVMVAENQTRQAFSQTLLAFDKAVEPGDTAFFFYAGHGFEIAGQNFLLPTDVPAATEGQEELVRDASVLADRIIERMQNKKVRTAILVFDACRNNPFERKGTRAVAGGGGLAPMTQLPEGVFSIFSAGPRQTALDRLSDNDDNPNSVFTRTFARQLTEPGVNLVQVAQRTRRLVSEMAETVRHKQIPVYFDQMVDDVFLNGLAKGQGEAAKEIAKDSVKPAEPLQKLAALPPVQRLAPQNDSVNAPIAAFSRHNGGWTVVFSIADPTLGISWRIGEGGEFREPGFVDTLDPRTRKRLEALGNAALSPLIEVMRPLGFLDYVRLQTDAACVISDSGTLTEESSILGFPAIMIRQAHERPEGMDEGAVIMAGLDATGVLDAIEVNRAHYSGASRPVRLIADYDADNVSRKVLRIILSYTEYVQRTVWPKR